MPTRLPVQNYELSNARVPNDDDSQDVASVVSDSITEDQDGLVASQYSAVSRKRKRSADLDSIQDQQHQIWADSLLDYFMLLESDERFPAPPEPPPSVNLDRPIDDKGHSAMHWAASMGDVAVTRDLIARGARIDCLSNSLETPLMRAVLFTNNYDKDTMPKLITFLLPTVANADWFGSTVFHHIAATTSSRNKYFSARYYLDTIINKLTETWPHKDIQRLLDVQDQSGDTALMIAARNGARKCVRALLGRHVATDTVNRMGESADDLIREMNARRQDRRRNASSSPFQAQSVERANGFPSSYPNSATLIGTQTSAFSSETAAALKHKFMPAIAEKCDQLAAAYEVELEEKEVERGEAERVLRKRQLDCDATRKQIAELQEQTLGEPVDQTLDDEYNALIAENESLLELEQTVELGRLVAEEERKASETIQMQSPTTPQDQGRVQLTQDLTRAQNERRALVIEIVRSQGYAGDYERQAEYKRLITGALGVKENDVENMLPEILSELEDAQERDRFETSPM